ncbi:Nitrogen regulation protein NtrY [hydrothermal vent metagenome]|uniref:histidine kinase n=1 Tax=hydrothermal vent metagenome TaxID=652676 RepID=A0A3B0R0Q0_9ZZZZ
MAKIQRDLQHIEQKRRKREYIIILAILPVIALITYIESHISLISGDVPIATNIFVLGLININIILLGLLIFLVIRNTVKIFFEGRGGLLGSKLRIRLIASFVALTIVPTFLLFFVVIGFVNKSIDGWFDINVEGSLQDSLELAQNYYQDTADKMLNGAWRISGHIGENGTDDSSGLLTAYVTQYLEQNEFSAVAVYTNKGERIAYGLARGLDPDMIPDVDIQDVASAINQGARSFTQTLTVGDVVRGVAPYSNAEGEHIGAVAVSYYVPSSLVQKMKDITNALEGYKQLKILKNPVKASYFSILLIITLLIVFFSIWIAQYLAKSITGPILELAEGTHAVASGNLDYRIEIDSKDEIGSLVTSFNRMTEDLKAGKSGLEKANKNLRRINVELDSRRNYIEIVMDNIPAGVMAIDSEALITSINRVAADIFGIEERRAPGSSYIDTLRGADSTLLTDMIGEMQETGVDNLERQIKIEKDGSVMIVLVNMNALRGEGGKSLGVVAVLDDLTHLVKTQRMFAWKEVARRIAHEIKNPLTPIQLSAQRLRRKYLDRFPSDSDIFDECTNTIIRQVDELKTLVNEFSSFARMASANPMPTDLNLIVDETMELYRPAHKRIEFKVALDPALPILDIDRDQIKRVLINLIDNAIDSMDGAGELGVKTTYEKELDIARIEVIDNGCGIPPESKSRLFEPYFSTKSSGTGLGLSIVSSIISDHNGYIRVKDNKPRGTRFIIELPASSGSS